jgi:hypothetical protein
MRRIRRNFNRFCSSADSAPAPARGDTKDLAKAMAQSDHDRGADQQ